jgi:REP element-mobilizing transposase RayT
MARPLRLEYPGAVYHLTSRGDRREPIYRDDGDREAFLHILGLGLARFHASALAYCLMGNHYHLVVQTEPLQVKRPKPARDLWRTVPRVVRVDEGTAAGAELVAAALQDAGRATLVGQPTLGHTRIRTAVGLPEVYALVLATHRWVRPNPERAGRDAGMQPDLPLRTEAELDAWQASD